MLGRAPQQYWRLPAVDRSLIEAHLYRQDALNLVGVPSWIARDPERHFVVDEVVDGALAVLDEAQDEMSHGGGKNYGVRLTVIETDQPTSPAERLAIEPERKRNRDETLG